MDKNSICALVLLFSCQDEKVAQRNSFKEINPKEINTISVSTGFDFPVGDADGKGKYRGSDGKIYDGWRIAAEFLDTSYKKEYGWHHPAEDWNGVGGGNTDFGQPVYAISNGRVLRVCDIHFFDYGKGKEVAIEHVLPDSSHVYSVYWHMDSALVVEGQDVDRREQVGTIGTEYGKYPAHLHFEIRNKYEGCFFWPGGDDQGLSIINANYMNPSVFITTHRTL